MTDAKATELRQADIDKIAAMTHPVRRRMLDLLGVDGPATVGALAEQTAERVGSISHHLKMLAKAGLVEEAPELARDRRESWWRIVTASWKWSIGDFEQDPAGEVVVAAAEQSQLRSSVEKAQQWYATRDDYDPAWAQAASTSTAWFKLTPDELADLGQQLSDVIGEFAAARGKHTSDEVPAADDDQRESVYIFTYAIPARP